jgi:DNA-binding transcriptional LysR family regulator
MAETHELANGLAGVLRVGFTLTTEGQMLIRLIETFQTRHPECRVEFHEVDVWDPYTALRSGTIDVLVNWLAGAQQDLTAGPAIEHAERVLAVGRHHNLARAGSVSLEQLADEQVAKPPISFPAALADALLCRLPAP